MKKKQAPDTARTFTSNEALAIVSVEATRAKLLGRELAIVICKIISASLTVQQVGVLMEELCVVLKEHPAELEQIRLAERIPAPLLEQLGRMFSPACESRLP